MTEVDSLRVKMICAVTFAPAVPPDEVIEDLEAAFGLIERKSEVIDFNHTNYYADEMGDGLKKFLVSFERPLSADNLWLAKRTTIDIESIYAAENKRKVNLDPGYVEPSKLVLASTKNFSHRIYLNGGIYAEVTLIYSGGRFNKMPWTYPDYLEPSFIEFLELVRVDCKSLSK